MTTLRRAWPGSSAASSTAVPDRGAQATRGMMRSRSAWAPSSDRPSVIATADFHTRMRWSGPLAMRTPVVPGGGAVTVSDARRTSQAIMMCKQDYPIAEGGQLDLGRVDLGRGQPGATAL